MTAPCRPSWSISSRSIKVYYATIVRLDKALYGCVESAKLWYDELCSTLLDLGYARNAVDQSVFNKGVGMNQCTVCVHVGDLMITCCEDSTIEALLAGLTDKYKTLTVHRGKVHSYLGIACVLATSHHVPTIKALSFYYLFVIN